MKSILILGGSGFIGNCLYKELSPYYNTFATYNTAKGYKKNHHFFYFNLEEGGLEAILKEDKRHIIPKRIMYFDTDSHNMLSEETFDDMGLLMAYREFPIINFYDQPMCLSIHSATYYFATRRYQLQSVRSTDIPKVQWKLNEPHHERMFTPEGLKRFAG